MIPLKDNNPTESTAWVTIGLIVANTAMYLFFQKTASGGLGEIWSPSSAAFTDRVVDYGAIPYEFTHPGDHCDLVAATGQIACEGQPGVTGTAEPQPATPVTAFTSMFMHGGLLHLGGNMLFLWIFGNNIEDAMGRLKFLAFYVLGGLAALTAQIAVGATETVPTIGASGAVAAVLGGYLLLYPRARVVALVIIVIFFTIVEIPAFLVLLIWFLQQLAFGALDFAQPTGGEGGGVAYFAHIGGFAFGLVMIKLFVDDRPRIRREEARWPAV